MVFLVLLEPSKGFSISIIVKVECVDVYQTWNLLSLSEILWYPWKFKVFGNVIENALSLALSPLLFVVFKLIQLLVKTTIIPKSLNFAGYRSNSLFWLRICVNFVHCYVGYIKCIKTIFHFFSCGSSKFCTRILVALLRHLCNQ